MAVVYSQQVLEDTPEKVTSFLVAIGMVPEIRAALRGRGMTNKEAELGRELLLAVLRAELGVLDGESPEAIRIREAVVAIDAWDESTFQQVWSTAERFNPGAGEYLFYQLQPSKGPASVKGVATFLSRLDKLEAGTEPARAEFKKQDKELVKVLAERGLDKAERQRMAELVKVALSGEAGEPQKSTDAASEERQKALVALRAWYNDWATTARTVIRKRSHLIRLGLAKRKRAEAEDEEPVAPPVAVTPTPPVTA